MSKCLIKMLDGYFMSLMKFEPLALLGKAISKMQVDTEFANRFERTLLTGTASEVREMFAEVGFDAGDKNLPSELQFGSQIDAIQNAVTEIKPFCMSLN